MTRPSTMNSDLKWKVVEKELTYMLPIDSSSMHRFRFFGTVTEHDEGFDNMLRNEMARPYR